MIAVTIILLFYFAVLALMLGAFWKIFTQAGRLG